VSVSATDSLGAAAQVPADVVRPLVVGAAWKVLDQLIELGLEQAGVGHDRGSDYTIKLKVRHAAAGTAAAVPPLDSQPDLWARATATYASTEAIRNSLAHRRLTINPTTGTMSGIPRPGEHPPQSLTVAEQVAFCQVAGGVAEAVITGALQSRRADQLRWALDQLTAHHQMPSFGATAASGLIPVVVIRPGLRPSNIVILDPDRVRDRARVAVGGVTHYDLEIHLPDGRVLAGPLEDAPSGTQSVSVDHPPTWLRWL
jgi:hypothetical protein